MEEYKSKRHPAFEVTSLKKAMAYLEQNQIKTIDEKPIPNVKRFSLYDPFGNRIEFLERN